MQIEISGTPFSEWKYTIQRWWQMRDSELLARLPMDGSARLLDGVRTQVEHLQETGSLAINVSGAHSSDYVSCDLPIRSLCFLTADIW